MQDERTVRHPTKGGVPQMPRGAFPAPHAISDDDAEGRENAGAGMRGPTASSTSEASDLANGLMDVPQVAGYPRASKTSAYRPTERQKIPTIRIGRLLKSDTVIGQSITPVLADVIINVIYGQTKQIPLCNPSLQSHVFSELYKGLFHSEQQVIGAITTPRRGNSPIPPSLNRFGRAPKSQID